MEIWNYAKSVFGGSDELGEVTDDSGAVLTVSAADMQASRPEVRCNEPGRVFTEDRLCGEAISLLTPQFGEL